jgi:hypothetical protein
MSIITDAKKDVKDMVVAGCRVQLYFRVIEPKQWTVQGTVRCGIDDHAAEQSFHTAGYPTREEAEQEALRRAADLLGNNVDRNTSRINNMELKRGA